jgi:hypothetical protein
MMLMLYESGASNKVAVMELVVLVFAAKDASILNCTL